MHELVTIIAKYFVIIPVILAFYVWLKLAHRQKIEFLALGFGSAIVAIVLAKLGSHLFYDPRPFVSGHFIPFFAHGNDNGFPSDHTLLGSLIACATLVYNRRLGAIALAFAVLVGLARVIAGVHHLLDIVGSVVISALAVALVNALLVWWSKKHKAV